MRRRPARARRASTRRVAVGSLRLPSPIVAASGTFGHGDEVLRLVDPDRLGAITVKSLAAFAWDGNPPPAAARGPGGGMLNSVGLQGPGVADWTVTELQALPPRRFRSSSRSGVAASTTSPTRPSCCAAAPAGSRRSS